MDITVLNHFLSSVCGGARAVGSLGGQVCHEHKPTLEMSVSLQFGTCSLLYAHLWLSVQVHVNYFFIAAISKYFNDVL